MTSTLTKYDTSNQNIKYRKNERGNGDISSDIAKAIKKQTSAAPSKSSKALQTQLEKINAPMKQYDKAVTKSNQKKYNSRMEKEKDDFHKNLQKIAKNQTSLKQKLNTLNSKTNNKNYMYSKHKKLPNKIEDIDDDVDLSKLLLKNPEKMTEEEKAFIASFSNNEFKLFIEYLKMKDKEFKWMGNGYGSGHYLEGFISIYRKYGSDDNKRYASLKNFLKLNNEKYKEEKLKEENKSKNENLWKIEENVEGDNMGNLDNNELLEEDNNDAKLNRTAYKKNKYDDEIDKISKRMMKDLDNHKKIMTKYKNDAELVNYENTMKLMNENMDMKKKNLQNDTDELKKEKEEIEKLDKMYEKYINQTSSKTKPKKGLIGVKIKKYLRNMNLTGVELAKRFLKHDEIFNNNENNIKINEGTAEINYNDKYIYLDDAETLFVSLKILEETESKYLIDILKEYNGNRMRFDIFADFLEHEDYKKHNNDGIENDTEENKNDNSFDSNYSYDNQKNSFKSKQNKIESLKQEIELKYKTEIQKIIDRKNIMIIQKNYRMHLVQKKVKSERIYLYILAKRITKLLRKNYEDKMKIKNIAATKITHLLKKNYLMRKDFRNLSKFTSRWIKDKKGNDQLYKKKINSSAALIQKHWRQYEAYKNALNKNQLDIRILKTKFCFICKKHKITHLCKECENNHYCEGCFIRYHKRGNKRNHNYLAINDILKDKDVNYYRKNNIYNDPQKIDNRETIKNYLNNNNINLNNILSAWDFNGDKTIKYKTLKDAIELSQNHIDDVNIQNLILEFAKDFVINGKMKNMDDYVISLEFVYDLSD